MIPFLKKAPPIFYAKAMRIGIVAVKPSIPNFHPTRVGDLSAVAVGRTGAAVAARFVSQTYPAAMDPRAPGLAS